MGNEERFPLKKYRQVSELRTQFQCEYRLLLRYKHGEQLTEWSQRGSKLHDMAANRPIETSSRNSYAKIVLFIITVVAGILWIMW